MLHASHYQNQLGFVIYHNIKIKLAHNLYPVEETKNTSEPNR